MNSAPYGKETESLIWLAASANVSGPFFFTVEKNPDNLGHSKYFFESLHHRTDTIMQPLPSFAKASAGKPIY
jgi:hypothetical protein